MSKEMDDLEFEQEMEEKDARAAKSAWEKVSPNMKAYLSSAKEKREDEAEKADNDASERKASFAAFKAAAADQKKKEALEEQKKKGFGRFAETVVEKTKKRSELLDKLKQESKKGQ